MSTVGWYLIAVGLYGCVSLVGPRWRTRHCRRLGRHDWKAGEHCLICSRCDTAFDPPDVDL